MPTYPTDVIADLIDGRLPWEQTKRIMSDYKDSDRFDKYIEVLQARVPWPDRILLPIGEHLQIVQKGAERVVKCDCGHEFGPYTENWKLAALIFVRDTEELLDELYPGPKACDPRLQEIREFICPSCGTLLEVEAVPPGYPVTFDFLPDLEGFYEDVLGRPLPTAGVV
jgi:acetone carboxylase, gamma subunit